MSGAEEKSNISGFIASVRDNPRSSFYRQRWGDAAAFGELPVTTRQDIARAPLSQRRYKDESSLIKIVHSDVGPFLSEWSFADIAKEPWAADVRRPLVYMDDVYEGMEKSMWCYENGILPAIGGPDPELASFVAEGYRIDALITDTQSVLKLLAYLQKRSTKLACVTVVGEVFDTAALAPLAACAREVRLVFALPEVGAIAESTLSEAPVFTPVKDCLVEDINGEIVVTKLNLLITPIVRYRVPQGDSLRFREGSLYRA